MRLEQLRTTVSAFRSSRATLDNAPIIMRVRRVAPGAPVVPSDRQLCAQAVLGQPPLRAALKKDRLNANCDIDDARMEAVEVFPTAARVLPASSS